MSDVPKFFGKVPVGTKGQIVIPAEARKEMNIKPGDSVIIMSSPPHHRRRMISVFPEEEFGKLLQFFEQMSSLKEKIGKDSRNKG